MRRCFLFIFISLPFCCSSQADSAASNYSSLFEPGLSSHLGKLVKIHGEYPENKMSGAVELCASFKTRGKKSWQSAHRFPSIGISAVYTYYGNPDVLGSSFGLAPTIKKEWHSGKMLITARGGIGAAWFNKPYNAISNPENLVIGTSVAALVIASFNAEIPLGENWRVCPGISVIHNSDGHLGVPNIGANIISGTVGIVYSQKYQSKRRMVHHWSSGDFEKKWHPSIGMLLGLHEFQGTIKPVDGPLYPVYGITIGIKRTLNDAGGWIAGFDTYYYTAFHDYIISQELFSADEANMKAVNLVVFAGYEWRFGRFGIFFQGGINAYAPFYHRFNEVWDLPHKGFVNEWTASKLGYTFYFIKEKISLSAALKSNGGTADFFEFGIRGHL